MYLHGRRILFLSSAYVKWGFISLREKCQVVRKKFEFLLVLRCQGSGRLSLFPCACVFVSDIGDPVASAESLCRPPLSVRVGSFVLKPRWSPGRKEE